MERQFRALLMVAVALLAGSAVRAHHSMAPYDLSKPITIEGVVTKFEYTNPHAYLYVMTENGEWGVEFGSVSSLKRRAILRNTFNVGDRVRLSGAPRKDGMKEMAGGRILNAAGEEIFTEPRPAPTTSSQR